MNDGIIWLDKWPIIKLQLAKSTYMMINLQLSQHDQQLVVVMVINLHKIYFQTNKLVTWNDLFNPDSGIGAQNMEKCMEHVMEQSMGQGVWIIEHANWGKE